MILLQLFLLSSFIDDFMLLLCASLQRQVFDDENKAAVRLMAGDNVEICRDLDAASFSVHNPVPDFIHCRYSGLHRYHASGSGPSTMYSHQGHMDTVCGNGSYMCILILNSKVKCINNEQVWVVSYSSKKSKILFFVWCLLAFLHQSQCTDAAFFTW